LLETKEKKKRKGELRQIEQKKRGIGCCQGKEKIFLIEGGRKKQGQLNSIEGRNQPLPEPKKKKRKREGKKKKKIVQRNKRCLRGKKSKNGRTRVGDAEKSGAERSLSCLE